MNAFTTFHGNPSNSLGLILIVGLNGCEWWADRHTETVRAVLLAFQTQCISSNVPWSFEEILTIGFLWCSLPWACKERQHHYLLEEDLEDARCALMTSLNIASVLSPTALWSVCHLSSISTFSSRSISTRARAIHHLLVTHGQTFGAPCCWKANMHLCVVD